MKNGNFNKKPFPSKRYWSFRRQILFLTFFASLLFTSAYAQEQSITIRQKNKPLSEVLNEIESKSGYLFLVRSNDVNLKQLVSVDVVNKSVENILALLFKNKGISYEIKGKSISIFIPQGPSSKKNSKDERRITGMVTDSNGNPIIGATILLKGSTKGTNTDVNGKFILSDVSEGSSIKISYMGFMPLDIKVIDNESLLVKMEENDKALDEVVVVGYGTQKKVNLTGAVSTISKRDINERPVSNLTNALKGADPSMYIKMASGTQDAGYSIDIRGSISVNGGSPLVLVDGVETSLNMLNPRDVESISVLKDASASAIYGAKASAGVVLVTTKSGAQGQTNKPTVTYDGRYGLKQSTTSTDFNTSGYWSAYIADAFYNQRYGMNYTNYTEDEYKMLWDRRNDKTENSERPWVVTKEDGTYRYYSNTDWYGYLWNRTMAQNEHNLSIMGGNDKVKYYVSGRYFHDDGLFRIVNDKYDTYSFRSKLDINLSSKVKYHNNVNYFTSKNTFNGYSDRNKTFYLTRVHGLASFAPTNPDGTAVYLSNQSNTSSTIGDGMMAALINGKHRNINDDKYVIIGNQFDIDLAKDLKLTASHSYKFRYRKYANRCVNVPYSTQEGNVQWLTTGQSSNNYNEQHYYSSDNNFNIYATYQHNFEKKHNLTAVMGWQYENYASSSIKVKRKDLLSDELDSYSIATGELEQLTQEISDYRTLGMFGRVNYDYMGKYLFEGSARYDASSRFAPKSRWGFFPSASAGWRISEEDFWEPLRDVCNNAKIRFSEGSLGNQQVENYSYIDKIYTDGLLNYTLDGSTAIQYAYESAPISSNLTWETVTSYDLGLDLSFLKSRLNLTSDVYIRDTKDMLTTSLTLPAVYGANSPKSNCANLRTNGWEIQLSWRDKFKLANKDFSYGISGSIGDYKTTITKYDNPNKLLSDYYEGMTLGEIWGYHVDGLFASDEEAAAYTKVVNMDALNATLLTSSNDNYYRGGDLKYVDIDGDNIISQGAVTADNPGDRRIIGNSLPRYSYTVGGNASWNNIDFSFLLSGVGKQNWYPSTEAENFWFAYSRAYSTYMAKDFLSSCWAENNKNAYFPRMRGYQSFSGGQLYYANDRYLQNVAYLRLKNITLGYTLPGWRKIFQQCRVYVTGENLGYLSALKKHTKYIDPEQTVASSEYQAGSAQAYGFTKSFSVGIDITF